MLTCVRSEGALELFDGLIYCDTKSPCTFYFAKPIEFGVNMGCVCKCTCGWIESPAGAKRKLGAPPRWNENKIVDAIAAIGNAGISLKVVDIERDRSTKARELIKSATGRAVFPRSLYSTARRNGFEWINLVTKAGVLKSNVERRKPKTPPDLIIEAIRELHSAGFLLNTKDMRFNKNPEKTKIITRIFGLEAQGSGLYKRAQKRFGSWAEALRSAGFEPKELRIVSHYRDSLIKTRERLLQAIQTLDAEKLPLNYKKMRREPSPEAKAIVLKCCGPKVTVYGVYRRSCLIFGSWKRALIAAGIDPNLARPPQEKRPSKSKSRYGHLPVYFEGQEVQGTFRTIGHLGFAPKTPEEVATTNSILKDLHHHLSNLPSVRRAVAEKVLLTLMEVSEIDELHEAIKFAAQDEHDKADFVAVANSIFADLVEQL